MITSQTQSAYARSRTALEAAVLLIGLVALSFPVTAFAYFDGGASGTLVVEKTVVNDNGAQGVAEGFSFLVEKSTGAGFVPLGDHFFSNIGDGSTGAKTLSLSPGTYRITEDAYLSRGYAKQYVGCDAAVVTDDGTTTCAVTNDDIAPKVKLLAEVSGGSAVAADWTLSATGPATLSGASGVESDAEFRVGTYVVAVTGPAHYSASWFCDLDDPDGLTAFVGDELTVEEGDNVVCTATMTYAAPSCEAGTHLEGETCVPDGGGPSCDAGFHLEGNECVADAPQSDSGSSSGSSSKDHNDSPNNNGKKSSRGEILGTSTCTPLLTDYLKQGWDNDPGQVKLLQEFLNKELGLTVPVSGVFGPDTHAAVEAFQTKYWETVLAPWFEFPGSNITSKDMPTGFVYQTTRWQINQIWCADSESFPNPLI